MKYLLIIYLIVLSLLSFLFCHIIYKNKMKNDLFFFVICNFILSFSFLVFFFYYKDYLLSFVNMFFLLLNTIFLSYEIKLTYDKYKVLSFPYLIYIIFIFYLILDLFLMSQ
ncbi:MAG TPA: hypothetical protein DCE23_02040 [Firmicutes bacterium]|nr:hypothetical protein [Bacillota bacterium]